MSVKQIISSIAIVGSIATLAILNVGSGATHQTFLQLDGPNEVELAFLNYIGKYGRNMGTKEEYEYR